MQTRDKGRLFFRPACLAVTLGLLTLSGCASQSSQNGQPQETSFSHELYDGKPTISLSGDFPPGSVEEAVARGDQAYLKGNADLALYEYLRGLSIKDVPAEKTGPIYYKVGYIHEQKNNLALAQRAYEMAVTAMPEDGNYEAALGVVLLRQGQKELAAQQLSAAVIRDQLRQGREQYKDQQELELTDVTLDARSPQLAYVSLGIIADLRGEHGPAQELYQQVLQLNPRSQLAMLNLGYSLYLSGELDAAEIQTRKAIALNNADPRGWSNLGLIYVRKHRYEDAAEVFSRVMPAHEALNDVGYLAMLDGQYEVAVDYLQQAIEANPQYYPKAQSNLKRAKRLQLSRPPVKTVLSEAATPGSQATLYELPAARPAPEPVPVQLPEALSPKPVETKN